MRRKKQPTHFFTLILALPFMWWNFELYKIKIRGEICLLFDQKWSCPPLIRLSKSSLLCRDKIQGKKKCIKKWEEKNKRYAFNKLKH